MHARLAWLGTALLLLSSATAAEPVDKIQGQWLGEWKGTDGMGGKTIAQICGLGGGEYQATFTAYDSGEQDSGVFTFFMKGASDGEGQVVFDHTLSLGNYGTIDFKAAIADAQLKGKYGSKNFTGTLELKRVDKPSDRVGAKPLPGAIVLLDGDEPKLWKALGDGPSAWKCAAGVLTAPTTDLPPDAGEGHLASLETFGDAQIHIEFRTPYVPAKRGVERGSGGIFLQGRYELQIVDSFGFPRTKNSSDEYDDDEVLGAFYHHRAPTAMPAAAPGEWQAFDIDFKGAKRDAAGKVTQPAEASVQLNGVPIHERIVLKRPTENAPVRDDLAKAGLILQDGGQPVEYRNIWWVPLDLPAK